jgi:hypothetical protein
MFIKEFHSHDGTLKACIYYNHDSPGCYSIAFFKNSSMIAVRDFPDKSRNYVDDAAENFVLGILKL